VSTFAPFEKRILRKDDAIIARVAAHFGVDPREMRLGGREWPLPDARHVAAYLLRKECGATYAQIARVFHWCDHHQSRYAVDKVRRALRDPEVCELLERLATGLVSEPRRA